MFIADMQIYCLGCPHVQHIVTDFVQRCKDAFPLFLPSLQREREGGGEREGERERERERERDDYLCLWSF